jgi:hypothetical protein
MSDKEYLNSKKCKCCGISLNKVKKSEIQQISSQDLVNKLNYSKPSIVSLNQSNARKQLLLNWQIQIQITIKTAETDIFQPNAKRVPNRSMFILLIGSILYKKQKRSVRNSLGIKWKKRIFVFVRCRYITLKP